MCIRNCYLPENGITNIKMHKANKLKMDTVKEKIVQKPIHAKKKKSKLGFSNCSTGIKKIYSFPKNISEGNNSYSLGKLFQTLMFPSVTLIDQNIKKY